MIPRFLNRRADGVWEIPVTYRSGMRVPGRIYATERLVEEMDIGVFEQTVNVACLPGIVEAAFCMPDGHRGYGFPIGGVAAFDTKEGVISPGGIGFDINCGMRLVRTNLVRGEVAPRVEELVDALFERVPVGVGGTGSLKLTREEYFELLRDGMVWALRCGYATEEDLGRTEDGGRADGADPDAVSRRAIERGIAQVGTLGSGNHYLEIQVVTEDGVFDRDAARTMGIDRANQVVVTIHCGSRGFGHQVAGEYVTSFLGVMEKKYGIPIRDSELACAPFDSEEGANYFAAMNCAINMAFANRQVILHRVREVFCDVFRRSVKELGLELVYDVTHNTAKVERHTVGGIEMELLVHRKGATRAFAPGMEGVPAVFRGTGQPVVIGGSMETGSYLLAGVSTGAQTFYTTAHGSGRTMGRREAKRRFEGSQIKKKMRKRGIYIRCPSDSGLAEEAGGAYKDIEAVVEATERAGISRRVARLDPIGNIKG